MAPWTRDWHPTSRVRPFVYLGRGLLRVRFATNTNVASLSLGVRARAWEPRARGVGPTAAAECFISAESARPGLELLMSVGRPLITLTAPLWPYRAAGGLRATKGKPSPEMGRRSAACVGLPRLRGLNSLSCRLPSAAPSPADSGLRWRLARSRSRCPCAVAFVFESRLSSAVPGLER